MTAKTVSVIVTGQIAICTRNVGLKAKKNENGRMQLMRQHWKLFINIGPCNE